MFILVLAEEEADLTEITQRPSPAQAVRGATGARLSCQWCSEWGNIKKRREDGRSGGVFSKAYLPPLVRNQDVKFQDKSLPVKKPVCLSFSQKTHRSAFSCSVFLLYNMQPCMKKSHETLQRNLKEFKKCLVKQRKVSSHVSLF